MKRAVIAGLTSSLIAGVLLIVLGVVAGSASGPDLAVPFIYLIGSTMIFADTVHRASGGEEANGWVVPVTVAAIGPSIPTVISALLSDATEPVMVQISQILILIWLPAFVGALAGALVAATR